MVKRSLAISLMVVLLLAGGSGVIAAETQGKEVADSVQNSAFSSDLFEPGDNYVLLKGVAEELNEGLLLYRNSFSDPLCGYINALGEVVLPAKYTDAHSFSEGLAYVTEKDMAGGYIDSTGQYIIPPVFDAGEDFYQGKAIVRYGMQSQIINQKGEFLLPQSYEDISFFADVQYYLARSSEKSHIYDQDLNLLYSFNQNLQGILVLEEKLFGSYVNYSGEAGIIDFKTGKDLFPSMKNGQASMVNGVFTVWNDLGVMRAYNSKGTLLLEAEGNFLYPLSSQVFFVSDWVNGKNYLVNQQDKQEVSWSADFILAPERHLYTEMPSGARGGFYVGVLDGQGAVVIPANYEHVFCVNEQWILAKKDQELYVFDLQGEQIKQFTGVAEVYYSGDFGFTYQDTEQILHVFNLDLQEDAQFQIPDLEFFYQDTNMIRIQVGGQLYSLLEKEKLDFTQPVPAGLNPIPKLDFQGITPKITAYFQVGNFKKQVNGKIDFLDTEVPQSVPVIINGYTMVPVGILAECFENYNLMWDMQEQSVQIRHLDRRVKLKVGSSNVEVYSYDASLNGLRMEQLTTEVPVQVVNDRTLVPLRLIAEALGLQVFWDESGSGLIGVSNTELQPSPEEMQTVLAGLGNTQATPLELQRMDASLATQPYLDYISAELLGVSQAENIANYSNTIPGYEALIRKEKDLILVTEPSADMLQMAKDHGVELKVTPFAKEGFVFLVNQDNQVQSLTIEQLQDIYQGKITNWKEVGGADLEIFAYQRNENSGSQTIMENNFMQGLSLIEPIMGRRIMSMAGLIDVVAEYQEDVNGALGYSVYYYAREMYGSDQVRLLGVNGVTPSSDSIRSGEYPIIVHYYAVTRQDDTSASTQKLLDYVLSEAGQACVNASGLVSVQ